MRIFVGILLTCSILFNLFFIFSDCLLDYKIRKVNEKVYSLSPISDIGNGIELCNASYNWISNGWKHFLPKHRGSVIENFNFNKGGIEAVSTYRPFYSSEEMWLQIAIYQNCICRQDTILKKKIEDNFFYKILPISIQSMSQSQIGMLAIDLYLSTGDLRYKSKADEVLHFLLQKEDSIYGINWSPSLIEVDENGMVVPFLAYYGKTFNSDVLYRKAVHQLDFYAKYGSDEKTGLPSHAVNLTEPCMKIGEANWGRGIAWWVIGLSYININDLTDDAVEIINHLDDTLLKIWVQNRKFGTLIRQTNDIDLSATMPILFYLIKNNKIVLTQELLDSFSQYLHDGLLYNCSGPKNGLCLSEFNQPNPLAQAFLLFLINHQIKNSFNNEAVFVSDN